MVLVLCEMQTTSYSIWTGVAISISYDNNLCITNTSIYIFEHDGRDSQIFAVLAVSSYVVKEKKDNKKYQY